MMVDYINYFIIQFGQFTNYLGVFWKCMLNWKSQIRAQGRRSLTTDVKMMLAKFNN